MKITRVFAVLSLSALMLATMLSASAQAELAPNRIYAEDGMLSQIDSEIYLPSFDGAYRQGDAAIRTLQTCLGARCTVRTVEDTIVRANADEAEIITSAPETRLPALSVKMERAKYQKIASNFSSLLKEHLGSWNSLRVYEVKDRTYVLPVSKQESVEKVSALEIRFFIEREGRVTDERWVVAKKISGLPRLPALAIPLETESQDSINQESEKSSVGTVAIGR